MFSLIITVISIALVAALAVSTLYFGGDAFNAGSDKAKAATIVNQAQQIDGANTIFRLDTGALASDLADDLVPEYLASTPQVNDNISSNSYSLAADGTITLDTVTATVCDEVNAQVGVDEEVAYSSESELAAQGVQYGCTANEQFIFSPDA